MSPGGGYALPGLQDPLTGLHLAGPASAAPLRNLSAPYPPLCRVAATPYPAYVRPAVNLFTIVAETADAGGLKIAETFPEGRGSPHGCGLRAVFCRDAASARPEACRDKSKAPRSGDFAGRSPGVQGAAATGRPLCAPCAIRDITQKINRERNLPGINIEVVALPNIVRTVTFPVVPLFRRVAATPYPAYRILSQAYTSQARQAQRRCAIYRRRTRHYAGWRLRLTRPTGSSRKLTLRRPGKRSAAAQSIGAVPAIMPGGGYALPGLQQLPGNPTRTTT